jgi:hypothetical protein
MQADQRPGINLPARIRVGLKPDQPQKSARRSPNCRRESRRTVGLDIVNGQRLPLLASGPLHDKSLPSRPAVTHLRQTATYSILLWNHPSFGCLLSSRMIIQKD